MILLRLASTAKKIQLGITLLFLLIASSLSEASMQVSPTKIFVAAERNAAGLTLLNTGNAILHAQVRVFEWRQQDGKNQLVPSHTIVASPPMLKLTPGVNQLVRIVRNGLPPDSTESSYRIIIDELPVPTNQVDVANQSNNLKSDGLQFRLRYSVPVFLAPSKQTLVQPVLNTRLIEDRGVQFLHISNDGNGHAQIADLTWMQGERRINIVPGLSGYVLPGQQRQWPLPESLDLIKDGAFTARINGELLERILVPITAMD